MKEQFSVNLDSDVAERLERLREHERRSKASMIEVLLIEALDARDAAVEASVPAEPSVK